jgi:hypothetical protein
MRHILRFQGDGLSDALIHVPDPPECCAGPDRRDGAIALAAAGAATLFHLFYFNHGVHNLLDLALPAVNASRILDGGAYGVDFQAPYGPARYYLIALHFALFGRSLYTLNLLFLAVMAVNSGLAYLAARHLVSRPCALFAAALVAVAHGSMHKGFYILAGLVLLHALLGYIQSGGARGAFRLGFSLVSVMLLRWDVGAVGFVALAAVLALMAAFKLFEPGESLRRSAARLALGMGIPGLPAAAAFLFLMNPVDFIAHTAQRIRAFQWYRAEYDSWSGLFLSAELKARIFSVLLLVFIVSMAACLVLGIAGLRKGRNGRRALLLIALALVAFPLLSQVHLIIRFNRFLHAAPAFFIAFSFILHAAGVRLKASGSAALRLAGRLGPPAIGSVLAALLLFYLYAYTGLASQDSFAVLRYKERFLSHQRARCYMREGLARDLEDALSFIEKRTGPTDFILAGPACPLVYFLADRRNPTRYLDWLYYYRHPTAERRILADIADRAPVLFVDLNRSPATITFDEACPNLSLYLKRAFRPVKIPRRATRFVFLERR